MDLKWCTKRDIVKKKCPIVFPDHPSNFTVTRAEKLMIWMQFQITRPVAAIKSLRFVLFHIISWPGGVKSYHAVLKFLDKAPHLTISFWMLKKKKKSFPCVTKNATGQRRYCYAMVSSWAIKHFDFQKLAGLWLARLINNHVRIYGSNVAEGFSAFQCRFSL